MEVIRFQHTSKSLIYVDSVQIVSFVSFPEVYVQTRRVVIAVSTGNNGIGASQN